jgi:hypothetical protein
VHFFQFTLYSLVGLVDKAPSEVWLKSEQKRSPAMLEDSDMVERTKMRGYQCAEPWHVLSQTPCSCADILSFG